MIAVLSLLLRRREFAYCRSASETGFEIPSPSSAHGRLIISRSWSVRMRSVILLAKARILLSNSTRNSCRRGSSLTFNLIKYSSAWLYERFKHHITLPLNRAGTHPLKTPRDHLILNQHLSISIGSKSTDDNSDYNDYSTHYFLSLSVTDRLQLLRWSHISYPVHIEVWKWCVHIWHVDLHSHRNTAAETPCCWWLFVIPQTTIAIARHLDRVCLALVPFSRHFTVLPPEKFIAVTRLLSHTVFARGVYSLGFQETWQLWCGYCLSLLPCRSPMQCKSNPY